MTDSGLLVCGWDGRAARTRWDLGVIGGRQDGQSRMPKRDSLRTCAMGMDAAERRVRM